MTDEALAEIERAAAWAEGNDRDDIPRLLAYVKTLKAQLEKTDLEKHGPDGLWVKIHTLTARNAELEKLARRVVEIFEPMQQKGQNGHTFELLLERAKKCLATSSDGVPKREQVNSVQPQAAR